MGKREDKERWDRISDVESYRERGEMDKWWEEVQAEQQAMEKRTAKLQRSGLYLSIFTFGLISCIFSYLLYRHLTENGDLSSAVGLVGLSLCVIGMGVDVWLFFSKKTHAERLRIRKQVIVGCVVALIINVISMFL